MNENVCVCEIVQLSNPTLASLVIPSPNEDEDALTAPHDVGFNIFID